MQSRIKRTWKKNKCYARIHLRLNKRFLDDKIGLWKIIPNGKTYDYCKKYLNKLCKLNWEGLFVSNVVMFLDQFNIDRKIQTLKCKPHTKIDNLFFYILPTLAHSHNTQKNLRNIIGKTWRHYSHKTNWTKEIRFLC